MAAGCLCSNDVYAAIVAFLVSVSFANAACEGWCESDQWTVENGQRHKERHCGGDMSDRCGGCPHCGGGGGNHNGGGQSCSDSNSDCAYWAQHGECQKNSAYMNLNCCASCSAVNGCNDKHHNCPRWAQQGECHKNWDYMKYHCCHSCEMGGAIPTPAPNPVPHPAGACDRDLSDQCAYWAQNGHCQSNPTYMGPHCCQSCGFGGQSHDGAGNGHCKEISVQAAKSRALNVALVPSAFQGNMALWREKAQWITSIFAQYDPLDAANIPGLNIWYLDVEVPGDNGHLCSFGCFGVPRNICCSGQTPFINHVANHCGTGFIMITIIVHNSETYGGTGYPQQNAAAISVNRDAPMVAAHELGHSLFGLGDEYDFWTSTPEHQPNCDVAGCPKWADLQGRWGVACKPKKCSGRIYFAAEDSTMDALSTEFGEANERIMCCKYLYHLHSAPRFCSKFSEEGLNLNSFCAGNVWKGDFTKLDTVAIFSEKAYLERVSEDTQGAGYVYVKNPVEWTVWKPALGDDWICTQSPNKLQPGVYLKRQVTGDVASKDDLEDGIPNITSSYQTVRVRVMKEMELVREMVFYARNTLSIPPPRATADALHDHLIQEDVHEVSEPRSAISIVLKDGEVCDPRIDLLSAAPLSAMGLPSFPMIISLLYIATSLWILR